MNTDHQFLHGSEAPRSVVAPPVPSVGLQSGNRFELKNTKDTKRDPEEDQSKPPRQLPIKQQPVQFEPLHGGTTHFCAVHT